LSEALVTNVDHAFGDRNRAKVNTRKGRLKIPHHGLPTEAGTPVSCSPPTPG
jgi:hypothetical protein